MSDEDAEDIAGWQAGWNTPAELVDAVVRRAAGAGVALDERLLEGHGNEVHAVTTAEGQSLIVRIGRRPGQVFEWEQWPISAARSVGIPAPEILLIEHTELYGRELSVEVQERMPGRPLYRLFDELSDERLTGLTREAGSLLARLHRVRPPGAGRIDQEGDVTTPSLPASDEMAAAMLERNRQLAAEGLDALLLEAPVEAVFTSAELLDDAPVSLIHGDWRTTNVLSDGRSITGVVDWEGARGGDPAFDFAGVWTVRSRFGATSTEILMESYRANGGSIDDGFDVRRLVYRIADLHSALGHFVVTHRPDLLDRAVIDLRSALHQFHTLNASSA